MEVIRGSGRTIKQIYAIIIDIVSICRHNLKNFMA